MTEAPLLTLGEVRQEVERIFRRDHRSRLVALHGRGQEESFEFDGYPWRVVPTRCELDLREHLPRPDQRVQEGIVYLVDWTSEALPLDIACRLAGGRLYPVARDARLGALFGARMVEPGLAGTALARLLLSLGTQPRKIQGLVLTRSAAWQGLLDAAPFRAPEGATGSIHALLRWAAGNDGGRVFLANAEAEDLWRAVRRELHAWLEAPTEQGGAGLGKAGAVVFRAWEQGLGGRLLDVLPILATARATGDAFLAGQVAGQMAAWLPDLAAAVREVEPVLTSDSVLDSSLPDGSAKLVAALERSQDLADRAGLTDLAARSDRLPGGHGARERRLGSAVRAFLATQDADHASTVVEALEALERHMLDAHVRKEDDREARRSIARLVLWLAGRPPSRPVGTRWQPAADLGKWYAEEGGHLEWARQQLRSLRGVDEALLAAGRELESTIAAALRADHRAFAEAYVAWVEAGKPSAAATPIEDVAKQVIGPFLRGGAHRKLLVVLMDGMSQASAVQLVTRLQATARWGPIKWRREGWHGTLPLPPVLAVAPTLTEVSRGAFFAGKADARFGDESTDKDPLRWRTNRVVSELVGEDAAPLFVRKDILTGYDLTAEVRDAIGSPSRAVAVVVNAIDENLRSSQQVPKDYNKEQILPLEALLSAAEESDRAVLLVADHGHVLGEGTRALSGRLAGGRPGGARWRALAEGEAPAPEEVVLPAGSWVPRGWHRVAVLWDPEVVNRSASYGEHGGLSLSEAVAPALLIARDWLETANPEDPPLARGPLPVPAWWGIKPRRVTNRPVAQAAEPPPQPTLFALPSPPTTPSPASVPVAEPPLVQSLRRSSVFQAQVQGQPVAEVDRVLGWLGKLAEAGGALPAADFAAAAGVRAHQVGGAVARMGILNADGFAMVEHDHVGRRVVLHRARLAQHYGVRE